MRAVIRRGQGEPDRWREPECLPAPEPRLVRAAGPDPARGLASPPRPAPVPSVSGRRAAPPARLMAQAGPAVPLRPQSHRRADPAPTRSAYRLRRLWMRAWVRRLAVRGVPVLVAAGALAAWLGDGQEIAAARAAWADLRAEIEARPEFAVATARVEGAGDDLAPLICAVLPRLPSSSLRLDLEAIRAEVAAFAPVARAEVRVLPGGVLGVRVVEREAAVVWRGPSGLETLDVEGRPIRMLPSRAARADLPLVAGEGAAAAVPEALALHEAAGPLAARLRGLVRVGERRWDAVLDGGPRLMLPEEGAEEAIERAAAMEAAHGLGARDVTHLDLRDPTRPVARLGEASLPEMARVLAEERAGPEAAATGDGDDG